MNKPALAAAFLVTLSVFAAQEFARPAAAESAFAARVIDGDTLETDDGLTVRMLGINTPEKKQYLYQEAKDFLKSLVEGKNITLERDVVDRDLYGRLLRYVFVNGTFVEKLILEKGLANSFIIPPNGKYSSQLREAEQHAKENGFGLWEYDAEYSGCIAVSEFQWDAAGNDIENLNGEYVSFRNGCGAGINMTEWTLKNSGTRIYKFGKYFLESGRQVKIRSGCGKDSGNELFWCGKKPAWNNNGDALYLRDSQGLLVLSESYQGNAGG